jgi:hypothetical protein
MVNSQWSMVNGEWVHPSTGFLKFFDEDDRRFKKQANYLSDKDWS